MTTTPLRVHLAFLPRYSLTRARLTLTTACIDDGTINSAAGTIYHIGQIFYDEDLLTQVLATSVYSNTTQTRTLNADDTILSAENTDGNNAYADTSLIGDSIEDGVLYVFLARLRPS